MTRDRLLPIVAAIVLAATFGRPLGPLALILVGVALIGAIVSAIHHAETLAHRLGEPFGTLILALAVTVIETSLVIALMFGGGPDTAALARDTVFSALMIILHGVAGLCLLVAGLKHGAIRFRADGVSGALATLMALAALTLVLPVYTTTTPGPTYSPAQLGFAAIASLGLYGAFVFVQTVRHRELFTDVDPADDGHVRPSGRDAAWASGFLLLGIAVVAGLAKTLSPTLEGAVGDAGLPRAVVGLAIALLILLPETGAAVRAAAANRVQRALNLSLGSALASIGLTVPIVVAVSLWAGMPLTLGLGPKEMVFLVLTGFTSAVTLSSGRSTLLAGAVHLVLFLAYVFLVIVP